MATATSVEAYIAKAPAYARPILEHLRAVIREALPDIEEQIKWGAPSFESDGMVAGMAAFKAHVRFGLWRASEVPAAATWFEISAGGQGARRIESLADLPPAKTLKTWFRAAARLNAEAAKRPPRPRVPKPPPVVPADLAAALRKHKKAAAVFKAFPPGHQREYVEWLEEAVRPETRARRLAKTLEQLAEGKDRNWKYRP
jgi:hypothetical protein